MAICDARKVRREAIKQIVDKHYGNSDCQMYPEMREFLATRPDIDAVLIATGDRWHSLATIMAMRAGKDVYSEKPSCMTIAEGREVVETARRYGRIYQTGVQRLSEANFRARHRAGPLRPARAGAHRPRPHRAVGCRRDEPRLAARGAPAPQGGSGLGRLAWPLPLAAVQLDLHQRRLAGPLRLPHQLHRRMGRAHVRPVAGRYRRAQHLGRRIPLCEERHRRRHGHQVRQRRPDGPLPRRPVLARALRHALRGDRRLGGLGGQLQEAGSVVIVACWKTARSCSPTISSAPGAR